MRFPEAVFKETLVREVNRAGIVDIQEKGRRIAPHLGTIINLELATGVSGRGMLILRLLEYLVNL